MPLSNDHLHVISLDISHNDICYHFSCDRSLHELLGISSCQRPPALWWPGISFLVCAVRVQGSNFLGSCIPGRLMHKLLGINSCQRPPVLWWPGISFLVYTVCVQGSISLVVTYRAISLPLHIKHTRINSFPKIRSLAFTVCVQGSIPWALAYQAISLPVDI